MSIIYIFVFLLILILLVIFICYKESNRILIRKSSKTPLTVFPEQFKVPYEKAEFKNKEGLTLKGWFIPSVKQSDKTIIFLHGWGQNKGTLLANTVFLRKKGFNLFYFDFRGSGESDQGPSSIGYLETKDAASALDYLKENYSEQAKHIGLYGLSMGAAVAVYTAAHRQEVECLVAEACYYSYNKVVARWARNHKRVPYFPLVALILYFARKRLGLNPEDFSPKKNIKKLGKKPLLIITGLLDKLAPRSDAQALFFAAQYPKQLWLVAGAEHTECAQIAGAAYQKRLEDFFTKYLGSK